MSQCFSSRTSLQHRVIWRGAGSLRIVIGQGFCPEVWVPASKQHMVREGLPRYRMPKIDEYTAAFSLYRNFRVQRARA